MTTLKYQITQDTRRVPYYNMAQQLHDQDGLEYRVIYDLRTSRHVPGSYHLEYRRVFIMPPVSMQVDISKLTIPEPNQWDSDIQSLEDHVSSCHFILVINEAFNTEFVCSDGEQECTDTTIPCEVRIND